METVFEKTNKLEDKMEAITKQVEIMSQQQAALI